VQPNPFNSTTTITYGLDKSAPTRLALYDLSGRQVRTLVEGNEPAGVHRTILSAANLPSGLYFVRLEASNQVFTQKVMLIR
jgi:serine protease AprX